MPSARNDQSLELAVLNALIGLVDRIRAYDRTAAAGYAVADSLRRRWRYPSW